jgi:hypothetical protein
MINYIMRRTSMVEYSEDEMNEMAGLCEDILWEPWQMEYPSVEESFTRCQTTYLGNNA